LDGVEKGAYEQKKYRDTLKSYRADSHYAQKGACTSHYALYARFYPMHLNKRDPPLAPGRENFPFAPANQFIPSLVGIVVTC